MAKTSLNFNYPLTNGTPTLILNGMKQLAKCTMHDELVRLSDCFTAEVNEIAYDTQTGKKALNKYKVFVCKDCAKKIGYKTKTKKGR
ncbi:MAG: protein of unknown function DUF4428 [Podoviridae sp. ctg2L5]|nr:MAG: protein of unknown function DUF4428 [Podoviridae sp. ctg2L5]